MTRRNAGPDDSIWLLKAVELSERCPKSVDSFAVGAILVSADGDELSTGFSLEMGPGTHAEESAITKAARPLAGTTLYSSLEPCSVRKSGKRPCVSRIAAAGIVRVVYALAEPPLFVECNGDQLLRGLGIVVVHLPQFGALVERVNRHLLLPRQMNTADNAERPGPVADD